MVPTAPFYDLLCRPHGRWMFGYLDMQDLAAGVADHEEGIEGLEP